MNHFHQAELREQTRVGAGAGLADDQGLRQLIETQRALAQEQQGENAPRDRRLPLVLEQGRETVGKAGGARIHDSPGIYQGRAGEGAMRAVQPFSMD
jgi:hypothetical protein